MKNLYHSNHIIKIGQNTEKSPGDLKRLAVTQTPVIDRQLTLIWKSHKKYDDGDNNDNYNNTVISIVIGSLRTIPQKIGKGTGRLRNKRTGGDHPDYCIIEIGLNTEESTGNFRRLAVIQTHVKNHQLTLV